MKLYVDEAAIGDDCALAAFTAAVDPELYKKKCSVLCVDTFDFLGTKYNGHLLSSLWRRVQMVSGGPSHWYGSRAFQNLGLLEISVFRNLSSTGPRTAADADRTDSVVPLRTRAALSIHEASLHLRC